MYSTAALRAALRERLPTGAGRRKGQTTPLPAWLLHRPERAQITTTPRGQRNTASPGQLRAPELPRQTLLAASASCVVMAAIAASYCVRHLWLSLPLTVILCCFPRIRVIVATHASTCGDCGVVGNSRQGKHRTAEIPDLLGIRAP